MLTFTEENYLKILLKINLIEPKKHQINSSDVAIKLNVKPATVNDMLKKLREKKLINFEKYGKVTLTIRGRKCALKVLRKHRLWETFLHEKLNFSLDEIHEVAEQLEHIKSDKLIDKLDDFLGFPKYDPHGEIIPDSMGKLVQLK
jgi:DtxR family Mn-dependent transcriptional regulator